MCGLGARDGRMVVELRGWSNEQDAMVQYKWLRAGKALVVGCGAGLWVGTQPLPLKTITCTHAAHHTTAGGCCQVHGEGEAGSSQVLCPGPAPGTSAHRAATLGTACISHSSWRHPAHNPQPAPTTPSWWLQADHLDLMWMDLVRSQGIWACS